MSTHYTSKNRSDRGMIKVQASSRRRCDCGCKGIATHIGTGNGAGMIVGCELSIRRWVRDGFTICINFYVIITDDNTGEEVKRSGPMDIGSAQKLRVALESKVDISKFTVSVI